MANEIEIVVKTKDETSKGFQQVQEKAKGLKGTLKETGSVAAGFLAANVIQQGFSAFTGFLGDAISEGRESNKVSAITANVIKTTGNAAKVTADQVGNLATSISNKTGVDDEAIQSGENLLLTFTNIRNETGKGNDIFNQASQAVTDMTAAMNNGSVTTEGLKASSIQLGKALNDPVKGVTALTKVGVTFSDQQKEQIKTLTKSGDILGAQKIILGEVRREFGGTAAASTTSAQKMQVAFGNVKEQIGQALIPVLDSVAQILTDKVIPAVSTAISWMTKHSGAVKVGAAIIGTVLVGAFIAWAVAAAQAAAATIAATWPVLAIIAAVALLAAGLVYAYTHWGAFRNAVNTAINVVRAAIPVIQAIVVWIGSRIGAAVATARSAWNSFSSSARNAVNNVRSFFAGIVSFIQGIPGRVGGALSKVFSPLISAAQSAVSWVYGQLNGLLNFVSSIPSRITGALSSAVGGVLSHIPGFASGGIVGAAGGGPRSNLVMVGEQGRELVRLPSGSQVHPHGQTESMMAGGGAGRIVLEIHSGGGRLDDMLVELLRGAIRVKGGNVQTVLGRS